MYDLSDLVSPDAVVAGVSAGSKKKLFALLADLAHAAYGVDPETVAASIAARERLGSTGFGGGIAIPHCKIDGLEAVRCVVCRLDRQMDYGAVDDSPVDLVFMLLSPRSAGAAHLKALARVSRCLRDRSFTAKLRGAGSADAIYALLTEAGTHDAAA
ncbi:PTS sugar transporter subunit IIA [Sphingomonas sp. ST-64]|uniref:PTS sugar transporter subunit IIA n=1 Tax=Sphingomonas plantiphila TaxID=3163295 RepID=A0ABW8YKK6_9SPHN